MSTATQIGLFDRLYTDTPRSRVSDPESSHADDGTGIDTITVLNTGRRRKTRDADANPEH